MTRKNIIARTVLSNNKIVSSRFFKQSQFEQMIMSHLHVVPNLKLSQFQGVKFIIDFQLKNGIFVAFVNFHHLVVILAKTIETLKLRNKIERVVLILNYYWILLFKSMQNVLLPETHKFLFLLNIMSRSISSSCQVYFKLAIWVS